jgi:hypothetical protein
MVIARGGRVTVDYAWLGLSQEQGLELARMILVRIEAELAQG